MADRVSPAALEASFATLRGYLDDLAQSRFEDHATKLRLFVNYFQKDEHCRALAERLRTRLGDVLEAAQRPRPQLPADSRDRVAFVYGVLHLLKQGHKLEVRELLSRAFDGPTLDHKWGELRQSWITPLADGLAAIETAVNAQLGTELVDPEVVFRAALDAVAGPSSAGASTLRAAVDQLASGPRADLALELEILSLEKQKRRRDPRRLEEIVATFERASPQLGALARVEAGLAPTS